MKMNSDSFRLFLLPEVEEKIRHYTALAAGEVSGLGLVEEVEGGFLVTRIFLPRQECSPGGTELDQDWVAALLVTLEEEGIDSGKLRCWFHSHSSFNVFWSPTNEECITGLANDNYYISLVVNKAGDMLARLDIFKPVRVTIDSVPVVVRGEDTRLLEQCRTEFAERVTELPGIVAQGRGGSPFRRDFGDDLFLPHWSAGDFEEPGPFSQVQELEMCFAEGELTWEEYCTRLKELEVMNG